MKQSAFKTHITSTIRDSAAKYFNELAENEKKFAYNSSKYSYIALKTSNIIDRNIVSSLCSFIFSRIILLLTFKLTIIIYTINIL